MNDVQPMSEGESLRLVTDMGKTDIALVSLSPLTVNTTDMRVIAVPSLEYRNIDALPTKMMCENNGRTVTLGGIWPTDRWPSVTGSGLNESYRFSHLHFHWNSDDAIGSEHVINGKGHALEMHLIFFKESCQTILEAESQHNGCITLAYLFDVVPNQHSGIDHITTQLNNILMYRQTTEVPVFPLSYLIQYPPAGEYFTYAGKINKLGGKCSVSRWIVFTKACGVSNKQMNQFRCILNKRGHQIRRNCRLANDVVSGDGLTPYLVMAETAVTTKRPEDGTPSSVARKRQTGTTVTRRPESEKASSTSVTSAGGDDARNSQRIRSVSSTHKVPSLSSAYETKADETNAAAAAAEEDEARRQRQMLLFVRPTKTQMLRRKFNEDKMQASINGRPSLLSTAEAPATTTVVMGIAANGNKLRAAVVDAQTAQRPTWK